VKALPLLFLVVICLLARPDGLNHHGALWQPRTASIPQETTNWAVLTGCTLISNRSNDGDSFHVRAQGTDRMFRLIGVDTLETDWRYPQRDLEQAAHFRISTNLVVQYGRQAQQLTRNLLSSGTFTVYTRWADALGAGRQPRYQAWVVLADRRELGDVLLQSGLARAHGYRADNPLTHQSAADEQLKLLGLERRAMTNHVGIWKIN